MCTPHPLTIPTELDEFQKYDLVFYGKNHTVVYYFIGYNVNYDTGQRNGECILRSITDPGQKHYVVGLETITKNPHASAPPGVLRSGDYVQYGISKQPYMFVEYTKDDESGTYTGGCVIALADQAGVEIGRKEGGPIITPGMLRKMPRPNQSYPALDDAPPKTSQTEQPNESVQFVYGDLVQHDCHPGKTFMFLQYLDSTEGTALIAPVKVVNAGDTEEMFVENLKPFRCSIAGNEMH